MKLSMKIDLNSGEFPPSDTYKVGRGEWEPKSALPDMWKVVHACKRAGLDIYNTSTIVHWHIFLKQHHVATLEEFLQKFEEGRQKKDFYEFSKYCLALYRKVHEMQLDSGLNHIEKPLIEQFMKETEEMDQLGDEYHADPKNDYWRRRASCVGPDYRELPESYLKLRWHYKSFAEFMKAHKAYKKLPNPVQEDIQWAAINSRLQNTAGEARANLER